MSGLGSCTGFLQSASCIKKRPARLLVCIYAKEPGVFVLCAKAAWSEFIVSTQSGEK